MSHRKSSEREEEAREKETREEMENAVGHEQVEPGKPSRSMNERGEITSDAAREVEEIAEQQGSSQRGYTDDQEATTERSPDLSPTRPDSSPDGELHR